MAYLIAEAVLGILFATGAQVAIRRRGTRGLLSVTILAVLLFNVIAYLDWRRDPEVVFFVEGLAVTLPTVVAGALVYCLRRVSRLNGLITTVLVGAAWVVVLYLTIRGYALTADL